MIRNGMHSAKSRLDENRERSMRFWNHETTDRPMVGALFNRMAPLAWFTERRDRTLVRPADLERSLFLDDCRRRLYAAETIGGDAPFVAYPFIGIPWLEAIFGCTVHAAGTSAWAEPLKTDWRCLTADTVPWENGWFDAMLEQTRALVELQRRLSDDVGSDAETAARYLPVGPCHLRGLGDLAAALAGQTEFCFALYDSPDDMHHLISLCADAWLRIVNAQFELIPSDAGGYWNGNQPVWSPGKTMFIPADVASLVSPDMFTEFFLDPMRRMVAGLDYSIMHTHSTYLDAYPLDLLLEIDELRAVQVGIDTNGPDIESVAPAMCRIAERKSLIVAGSLSPDQIRRARAFLPDEGVCYLTYQETEAECRRVLDELEIP